MISSNDFRTGTSIELDGQVWRVVEFLHVKPGKGSAFVRTKLKNVQSGSVVERTFRAGETVPQAVIEKKDMQHTYRDGDDFVFMDMETYEEVRLSPDQIGERVKYLKEEMSVNVVSWQGADPGGGTPEFSRARSYGNRSWRERRHGYRRHQTGHR